jgi:hypothetical protein
MSSTGKQARYILHDPASSRCHRYGQAGTAYGKDPVLRVMAEKIVAAQKAEIAELEKWQQEHPK